MDVPGDPALPIAKAAIPVLPKGVPMRFEKPFAGVSYGMGMGIVLDPAHADFNGGAIGAGSYYRGGVHGAGDARLAELLGTMASTP